MNKLEKNDFMNVYMEKLLRIIQRSLDIMKLYFLAFSCSNICWLTNGFSSYSFRLLSYSLHKE